jgi:hypothetical protein
MTGGLGRSPHARRVAGPEVLAVDDDDVPLHEVLRPGTGGRQGRAQVAQDLLGLCGDVADVPLGIDRVPAADLEGSLAHACSPSRLLKSF